MRVITYQERKTGRVISVPQFVSWQEVCQETTKDRIFNGFGIDTLVALNQGMQAMIAERIGHAYLLDIVDRRIDDAINEGSYSYAVLLSEMQRTEGVLETCAYIGGVAKVGNENVEI